MVKLFLHLCVQSKHLEGIKLLIQMRKVIFPATVNPRAWQQDTPYTSHRDTVSYLYIKIFLLISRWDPINLIIILNIKIN